MLGGGGDEDRWSQIGFRIGFGDGSGLGGVKEIGFVDDDDFWFLGEVGTIIGEFLANGVVVVKN